MVSFSSLDIIIIILFFCIVLLIGFISGRYTKSEADDYLLSGRRVGLFLFILTNVSAWYGGILGIGEFTYRYGIASWFTQGLPYYIFAFLFALFFAKKIRSASLFTIPDKITNMYGKTAGLISAVLVFVLVSPAPYVLMTGNLISLTFKTGTILSLFISVILSMIYLLQGGFRSNVFTDSFQFFVMFGGFILMLIFCGMSFGGYNYLSESLPASHLKLTGGASPLFILVWFLIALWTFADPGFHQRCYAAKTEQVAAKGILISIIFWALFDFLTTSTGLFARASLPGIIQPVLSFPLLAEKILPSGIKGIFYAGLFATIISTSNSFLFLSGTTIGRDFIFRINTNVNENKLKPYTIIGLIISGLLSILLAYLIPSVIEIWYTLGSLCIPAIIPAVISSYYPRFRIEKKIMIVEMIMAVIFSTVWYFLRELGTIPGFIVEIEPMIIGLLVGGIIHLYGLFRQKRGPGFRGHLDY
jgi:SSS family solute:Na+ symporter